MNCELCHRPGFRLTDHHLIPLTRHKNKRVKRDVPVGERKLKAKLCRDCHGQIHLLFSEKELERSYNSIEKLQSHPDIQRWLDWIGRKAG